MPKLLEWKVVHSAWVMWGLGRLQVICPLQGDTNEMHSSEKLSHQIETLLWTPFCSFKIWMARETKSYFFRLLNKFMPEENYVFMISYTDLEECSNYKVWSSLLWSKNLKIYLYYLPKITKKCSLRNCSVSASEILGKHFTLNRFCRRDFLCSYKCFCRRAKLKIELEITFMT